MRRWMHILLVGILTVGMSINSASACRGWRRTCRSVCHPCMPCVVYHHAPACGSVVTEECCGEAVVETTQPAAPAESVVQPETEPAKGEIAKPEPVKPDVRPLETPAAEPPKPIVVIEEKPMPVEPEAPVEPPAKEPPLELPAAATKPVEPPAEPATPPQPTEPAEPVVPAEPAEKPKMKEEPENLFPEEPKPAEQKPAAEEPKTPEPRPSEEDLFGGDEPAKPATAPPAAAPEEPAEPEMQEEEAEAEEEPATEPASEPKKETPAAGEENLFDDPGAEPPAKPAPPKPAAAEPEEDLFGSSDEPSQEDAPPADETADETTKEPTEEPSQEPVGEPVDEPAPADPTEEKPAEEKDEDTADEEEEDPFAGVLQTPDEPMRTWIDDTGRYRTVARLVEVRPEGVRLLKANGRFSTVPFSRLSNHDRLYASATAARVESQLVQQPKPNDTAGL